jgi:hypothetical protein
MPAKHCVEADGTGDAAESLDAISHGPRLAGVDGSHGCQATSARKSDKLDELPADHLSFLHESVLLSPCDARLKLKFCDGTFEWAGVRNYRLSA